LKRNAVVKPPFDRELQGVITARPDISLDIDGTKWVAGWIILVKRAHAVAVHIRRRDTQVHRTSRKQPDAMRSKIRRREQEIVWQLVIDGQSPFLGVEVPSALPL
jgi:hypothetical protein